MCAINSRIQRLVLSGLIVLMLVACGAVPDAQPSAVTSPAASDVLPTEASPAVETSAEAEVSTIAQPAGASPSAEASVSSPPTPEQSPVASNVAEKATDLQRAYAPFLFVEGGVVAVEEAARQMQDGEIDQFELLGRLVGAGLLVRLADDAFKAEPPVPEVADVWEDARAAHLEVSAVLRRWINTEISSADIPAELESIKPHIDTIMQTAERELGAAYNVDSAELERVRSEVRSRLEETLASPSGDASSVATASAVAEASEPAAVEPGASRAEPLALGTPLVFESWTVTVTEVLRGDAARQAIADANQFNDPPREGNEYMLATLQIENISDKPEAQSTSSAASLRLTGDRNTAYLPASVVTPQEFEGGLFPGGSAIGQEAFELPAGEGNLMFSVEELLNFDSAPRFIAVDEGARLQPDPALDQIAPADAGTQHDAPVAPGQTAITDDWEVTVLEAKRGADAAALASEANQFNDLAQSGTEYVAVRVRVRRIGTGEPDTAQNVGGGWLKLTGANNVVYDSPGVVAPEPRLDVYLYPGGEAEGWLMLSAAEGEQNLQAIWEPLFSFDDDQTRFLALE